MQTMANWDWSPGEREIGKTGTCSQEFQWMEEPQASPDGEKLAAVINLGEDGVSICVNGEPWGEPFEKIWSPRYLPDGRLAAIVSQEMEWTIAVDGEAWEEGYDFIWKPMWSGDGANVAVAMQSGQEYGMSRNGEAWETLYGSGADFELSPKGERTAAVVQVEALEQADIFKYKEGVYTVAVDGEAWDKIFVNCWTPRFNKDETSVACQCRTTIYDYTIAVDGQPWNKLFGMVWEPAFNPATNEVVAPVRVGGKWGMARDGEVIWPVGHFNLWHQQFSADGSSLWAIVSPTFGNWTLIKDGQPWSTTVGGFVNDLVVSPDGQRAAAICNENYKYSILTDNQVWNGWYEMAYKPTFSPDGRHVAAAVEKAGRRFTVLLDNRPYKRDFDKVFDPIFSPDSEMVLIRAIEGGKFLRIVVPVNQF